MCMRALRWPSPAGSVAGMMRVVLLAACSANVVAFATVPQKTTYACVDIGFPDDPNFKCADEAEACNDTSDLEWYNECVRSARRRAASVAELPPVHHHQVVHQDRQRRRRARLPPS